MFVPKRYIPPLVLSATAMTAVAITACNDNCAQGTAYGYYYYYGCVIEEGEGEGEGEGGDEPGPCDSCAFEDFQACLQGITTC